MFSVTIGLLYKNKVFCINFKPAHRDIYVELIISDIYLELLDSVRIIQVDVLSTGK